MTFDAGFDESSLVLEEGLSFQQRVMRYHEVYQQLLEAYGRVEDEVEAAEAAESLARYKVADAEHDRISVLLLPFVSAHKEAQRLAGKGYKLASWEGDVTPQPDPGDIEGDVLDALVALFMIYLEAAVGDILEGLGKQIEEAVDDLTLTDALSIVSGAVVLQMLADKWFKSDDNSELAQFMRDPIRRPEQILRNWREKLLDGDSKNIFSQTVGRPIREIARTGKKIEKEFRRARDKVKKFFKKPFG
jgi:hypothetical protein